MSPVVGTTSFAFRYLLMDRAAAPPLAGLLEPLRSLDLEAFQICENARPLELSSGEWVDLVARSRALGIKLSLGCMTLDPEVFRAHLERSALIPCSTVRIILELDRGGAPTRDQVVRFLDTVVPWLDAANARVAIENHFDLPCRLLAEVAESYPAARVGFCIDTANSLRKFEPVETVFDLLESRALCFHLKDYRVEGSNVGFSVLGTPLGQGDLPLAATLRRILRRDPNAEIYLENWVPSTGLRDDDIARDSSWLRTGVECLRAIFCVF